MGTVRSAPKGLITKPPQFGDEKVLRASKILVLDPAYEVSEDDLEAPAADEVELVFDFTKGTSTGCRIRIDTSDDKATWVQQSVFDTTVMKLNRLEVNLVETAIRSFRFVPGRRYIRSSAVALNAIVGTLLKITGKAIHGVRTR